jgi:hypothetical protein
LRIAETERLGLWAVDLKSGHAVALLDTGLRSNERGQLEAQMNYYRNLIQRCVSDPSMPAINCWRLYERWRVAANRALRLSGNPFSLGQIEAMLLGAI